MKLKFDGKCQYCDRPFDNIPNAFIRHKGGWCCYQCEEKDLNKRIKVLEREKKEYSLALSLALNEFEDFYTNNVLRQDRTWSIFTNTFYLLEAKKFIEAGD